MKAEVTLTDDKGTDAEQAMGKILLGLPQLSSYEVLVDSNHAALIEFGTEGATETGPKYKNGQISPVKLAIRKWVHAKFSTVKTATEENAVAERIYRSIMNNGIPPQPFFRPAIHEVFNGSLSDSPAPAGPADWLEKGLTLEDLAQQIADTMVRILAANDTIYTGELIASIKVQPSGSEETADRQGQTIDRADRDLPEEVWHSNTSDGHGRNRAKRAGK